MAHSDRFHDEVRVQVFAFGARTPHYGWTWRLVAGADAIDVAIDAAQRCSPGDRVRVSGDGSYSNRSDWRVVKTAFGPLGVQRLYGRN